ncbi:MAG: D-alanyl-D-alanine carboxypeptidase DacB [Chlamydiae bacterium]|nr:D-alanyl-D-alanine carboxypeptidase DacB [Chlamydiota bacterium]
MQKFICFFCFLFSCAFAQIDLAKWEQDYGMQNAFCGICIQDLDTHEQLFALNADKNFNPASLTKLYTSYLAAELIGLDNTLQTTLFRTGPIENGVLKGNLVLKGDFDPLLTTEDLRTLAFDVAKSGIKKIQGKILLDSIYSSRIPTCEWEDLIEPYGAETSDLNIDKNCVVIEIDPAKQTVSINEQDITFHSDIKFVEDSTRLCVDRDLEKNHFSLLGNVDIHGEKFQKEYAIHEPNKRAVFILTQLLKDAGVEIEDKSFVSTTYEKLTSIHSKPLHEIITVMSKNSDNLCANALYFKAKIIAKQQNFELIPLKDGAGLSRQNLLTPKQIVSLIAHLYQKPYFHFIEKSLPIAGEDGSLTKRFCNTIAQGNVKAKTGTFTNTGCLAGFGTTLSNRRLIFCVIINHSDKSDGDIRKAIDALILQVLEAF